ncbi:MAG: hypothetical protein ACTSO6_06730 [Promethearchaeota archaeon]
MSNKKKKYDDGVERDEDGLDTDERAIIDSIDFKKIGADAAASVAARRDEIIADAVKTSTAKTKRTGVLSLVIGIFLIIGGVVSLDAGVGIYLLISGALILIFGICMFSIARSDKKVVADSESGKVTAIDSDVAVQHDARAEGIVPRLKGTATKEIKPIPVKQITGVITFLIGFFLIFAAFALFLEEELGAYLLGGGAFLLIIGIILLIMARSDKKN